MKKPTVLWVGENRQRCLTLMEIYSDVVCSVYAENTDSGFLRDLEKSICAVVLVLGRDERADTDVCREIYAFSAKKRVPIYLMGQRNHLHTASLISPNAFLTPVRDDQFAQAFTAKGTARPSPRPAVVVFSETSECFVSLEERLSGGFREKLRIIYSEPTWEAILRLKKKKIKPKLFILGEDVYCGSHHKFSEALYGQAGFRKIPYLVFSVSDALTKPDPELPTPLAVIDIRDENTNTEELIQTVIKKR